MEDIIFEEACVYDDGEVLKVERLARGVMLSIEYKTVPLSVVLRKDKVVELRDALHAWIETQGGVA